MAERLLAFCRQVFSSIRWRIAIPLLILVTLSGIASGLYFSNFLRNSRMADFHATQRAAVRLLADVLSRSDGIIEPDSLAHHWAELLQYRVTVIDANGVVLGESHRDRLELDNHLDRPEVQAGLRSGFGSSIRYSDTLGYEMLYAAASYKEAGETAGVVRLAFPLAQLEADVRRFHNLTFRRAFHYRPNYAPAGRINRPSPRYRSWGHEQGNLGLFRRRGRDLVHRTGSNVHPPT